MISFWANRSSSHAIPNYCARRGRAIADRFDCRVYEDVGSQVRLRAGAHIFASLDRLTANQREAAAVRHDALAARAPDAPRLNDPRRVVMRFELLTTLHAAGLNSFRVFRATDAREVRGIRSSSARPTMTTAHSRGCCTRSARCSKALWALRARGWRLDELLAVEFCDTSDAYGVYRKYSAFAVGDRIVPCHVLASHQWAVKSESSEPNESLIRENMAYIERNPHEPWLRQVFSIAGAGYSRDRLRDARRRARDLGDQPEPDDWHAGGQNAEAPTPELERLREQEREAFHGRLRDAFTVALDRQGLGADIEVALDPDFGAAERRRGEAAAPGTHDWRGCASCTSGRRLACCSVSFTAGCFPASDGRRARPRSRPFLRVPRGLTCTGRRPPRWWPSLTRTLLAGSSPPPFSPCTEADEPGAEQQQRSGFGGQVPLAAPPADISMPRQLRNRHPRRSCRRTGRRDAHRQEHPRLPNRRPCYRSESRYCRSRSC